MINAISIALSGLNTASARLNASAQNIANATKTVDLSDDNNLQPAPSDINFNTTSNSLETRLTADIFNNSFTEEIVNVKTAEIAYRANLEVIQTTGELFDELINAFDDE